VKQPPSKDNELVGQDSSEPDGENLADILYSLLLHHLAIFKAEMKLFTRRDLLVAQRQATERHGTYPEVQKIQREIDEVCREIAKLAGLP